MHGAWTECFLRMTRDWLRLKLQGLFVAAIRGFYHFFNVKIYVYCSALF